MKMSWVNMVQENEMTKAHVAAVLWYIGHQRHQTGENLLDTKYCWTVNVVELETADTDWDFKCRINKSLYAR